MTARERIAAAEAALIALHTEDVMTDDEIQEMAINAMAKAKRLRIAYTTAPLAYDWFGTVVLCQDAGTDHHGQTIRKLGVEPDNWKWQLCRCASGMHVFVTEEDAKRYPDIYRLNPDA